MAIFKQVSLKDATAYKFCAILTKQFKPVVEKNAPNSDYMKKWFMYAKAPNAQICSKWEDIYSNMHAEDFYILCDCVPFLKGRTNERHKTYALTKRLIASIASQIDFCAAIVNEAFDELPLDDQLAQFFETIVYQLYHVNLK